PKSPALLSHIPQQRAPPSSNIFPYPTLFRSHQIPIINVAVVTHCNIKFQFWIDAVWHSTAEVKRDTTGAQNRSRGAVGNSHFWRSEEHTSELQSRGDIVCRLLLEKKNQSDPV